MNVFSISNSQGQNYDKYDVKKKLEDSGIPENVIAQGETAVENYASAHGITLPTSDQQKPKTVPNKVNGSMGKNKEEFEAKLEALGIPPEIIKQGKDAVKQYAAQHNIQLPEHQKHGTHLNLVA